MTSIRGLREAAFAGWFGPMGVAAIFYALLAQERTGHREIWVVGSLIVASSVLVHGATAAPLTRRLGAREPGAQ
jgi:NhaP-type Na+/H+ or K+/H+ antiporter